MKKTEMAQVTATHWRAVNRTAARKINVRTCCGDRRKSDDEEEEITRVLGGGESSSVPSSWLERRNDELRALAGFEDWIQQQRDRSRK